MGEGSCAVGAGHRKVGGSPRSWLPRGRSAVPASFRCVPGLAAAAHPPLRSWRWNPSAPGKVGSGPYDLRSTHARDSPGTSPHLPRCGLFTSTGSARQPWPLGYSHFLEFFSRTFIQVPSRFSVLSVFPPEISERPLISFGLPGLFTTTVRRRMVSRGSCAHFFPGLSPLIPEPHSTFHPISLQRTVAFYLLDSA